ncbi:hypothetical protein V6Z12_A10G279600 [Gossypium hirsutum]
MCASMIASAWTFLFFVILTNDISNFLNLYEWKFWKMIDKDMDKKATAKATASATATVTTTATIATTRITTTTKTEKGETMVNDHKLILNEQQELRRSSCNSFLFEITE